MKRTFNIAFRPPPLDLQPNKEPKHEDEELFQVNSDYDSQGKTESESSLDTSSFKSRLSLPRLSLDTQSIDSLSSLEDTLEPTLDKLIEKRLFPKTQPFNEKAAQEIGDIMREIYNNVVSENPETCKAFLQDQIENHCGKLTGHQQRSFEIDTSDYNVRVPQYIAYTCITPDYVLKLINCEDNIFSTFMVLKEIAFQIYASKLSSICSVDIPQIEKYGRVINDIDRDKFRFSTLWYIQMSRIQYANLQSQIGSEDIISNCDEIARRINDVIDCLGNNGIYHNDHHPENIFLDKDGKIGLIDYGISETYNSKIYEDKWRYNCDKLSRRKGGNHKKGAKRTKRIRKTKRTKKANRENRKKKIRRTKRT
jgi:hypothetical protein